MANNLTCDIPHRWLCLLGLLEPSWFPLGCRENFFNFSQLNDQEGLFQLISLTGSPYEKTNHLRRSQTPCVHYKYVWHAWAWRNLKLIVVFSVIFAISYWIDLLQWKSTGHFREVLDTLGELPLWLDVLGFVDHDVTCIFFPLLPAG